MAKVNTAIVAALIAACGLFAASGLDIEKTEVQSGWVAGTRPAAEIDPASTAEPMVLSYWSTSGNSGTTAGYHFLGTTDNEPLEIKVNNLRVLRLEPNHVSPSIIGGYNGNSIESGTRGSVICGGGRSDYPNIIEGDYSTIGGGHSNRITCTLGTIGGGLENLVTSGGGAICGGNRNTTSGNIAFIGGGYRNTASAQYSCIVGGDTNQATANYAFVGGGSQNQAAGWYSSISGGAMNVTGGIYSTIGGGISNTASHQYSTVGGGYCNTASDQYSTIGGGYSNTVSDQYSSILGGAINAVRGDYSSVTGGSNNIIEGNGNWCFIGGGSSNTVAPYASNSSILGGSSNQVSRPYSAVGGGYSNTASGTFSTVPGGYYNQAAGYYSFAAGYMAKANHAGSFVWADHQSGDSIASTANDQFIVRALGGVWLGTNSSPSIPPGQFIATSTGAYLSSGGTWTNASDRNLKEGFQPVNEAEILAKVAELPISTWNYKSEDPSVAHIGPVAQDFHSAFNLGNDNKSISTVDASGVALVSIQALYKENQELKNQLKVQQEYLRNLETRLETLEAISK